MIPKFRAYRYSDGVMYEVYHLTITKRGLVVQARGSFGNTSRDLVGVDVELMQSTGRQDNAGIEIYADEIVDFERCKAIVRWDDLASQYFFEVIDEDTWCDDWNFQDDAERCRVIGNIHANPELLK